VVSRKISPSVEKGFNFTVLGKCVSTARRMAENQFAKAKAPLQEEKRKRGEIG
jgi:hypothetical protein